MEASAVATVAAKVVLVIVAADEPLRVTLIQKTLLARSLFAHVVQPRSLVKIDFYLANDK